MKTGKFRVISIISAMLILLASIGLSLFLLFSNYQNIRLFKQAQNNFSRGDAESLALAEVQLLQVIRKDQDNEAAYIMLGEIAGKRKVYTEQVYYCYMAHRLNPLSSENKAQYIRSLCFARYFERLENFLAQQQDIPADGILIYAAGRNGNINKYKNIKSAGKPFAELALLLFSGENRTVEQKLEALKKFSAEDAFLQQEILAAQAELYLSNRDFDNAEKVLKQAYELNSLAFAPALGRFYANVRTFGKALEVLEKYLASYHDPVVAMQTAEIYCLLNQTGKIAKLRTSYQADTGNIAMLCCYYFDALIALAKKDTASLKELVVPLRKNVNTPLAAFMFLAADLQGNDLAAVREGYSELLAHRKYLDLQTRADDMVSDYLKRTLNTANAEQLLPLAELLYKRKPEVFTAKLILLAQKKRNAVNPALLKEALSRFSKDQGITKIGIEYYLNRELEVCEHLIARFKQMFPGRKKDMLRYEIAVAAKKRDHDLVSSLFQNNFSPAVLPEYWAFASSGMRENDLLFLARDEKYAPFCKALLLLKKGDRESACELLEKADAKGDLALLFFAAKTLAENGRNQAALRKYAQFPAESPYKLTVLLNMAELFAENGNLTEALKLSRQAYESAPDMPETQFCYADKLSRSGKLTAIPDVAKLSHSPYRRQMKKLWIAGMEARIKQSDFATQREKIREACRQLLVVVPDNNTALEYLKKLNKMPQ